MQLMANLFFLCKYLLVLFMFRDGTITTYFTKIYYLLCLYGDLKKKLQKSVANQLLINVNCCNMSAL